MAADERAQPEVTVLGASGYVGAEVVAQIARRGRPVRAVSRRGTGWDAPVDDRRVDLSVAGAVGPVARGVPAVVHAVAHGTTGSTWRDADDPASDRVNVHLLEELVDAMSATDDASTPPLLVYLSSAQAAVAESASRYAEQKIQAEALLRDAGEAGRIRPVVLRLPAVYGRSDATGETGRGFVAAVARRAIADEPLELWGDGSVLRDLLHVHDAARAITAALADPGPLVGRTWQLSAGRPTSLSAIFGLVASTTSDLTDRPAVPVVSIPAPEQATANDSRSDDLGASRFAELTGWRPTTTLEAGVTGVVETLLSGSVAR